MDDERQALQREARELQNYLAAASRCDEAIQALHRYRVVIKRLDEIRPPPPTPEPKQAELFTGDSA
jgi:hypothetical protein